MAPDAAGTRTVTEFDSPKAMVAVYLVRHGINNAIQPNTPTNVPCANINFRPRSLNRCPGKGDIRGCETDYRGDEKYRNFHSV